MIDHGPMKNSEGYHDPTSYEATANVDRREKDSVGHNRTKKDSVGHNRTKKDCEKVRSLIGTLLGMCDLAGFQVEGRIVLKDKKTGKIWR